MRSRWFFFWFRFMAVDLMDDVWRVIRWRVINKFGTKWGVVLSGTPSQHSRSDATIIDGLAKSATDGNTYCGKLRKNWTFIRWLRYLIELFDSNGNWWLSVSWRFIICWERIMGRGTRSTIHYLVEKRHLSALHQIQQNSYQLALTF